LAVALDAGTVVGITSAVHYVHPDKPAELWVNEVGVAPTHRRRGVGRQLLEAMLTHARALGCREAWGLTDVGSRAARRLYAAAGGREAAAGPVMVSFTLEDDGTTH